MTTSKPMPPSSAQQSLFAADTRASPFQQQENDRVRLTKDTSGRRCLELYEVSGRDGSLPKMLLDILNSVSTKLPHRWKLKASPSGRLLFQLAPLTLPTDEIEFGLWPTPDIRGFTNEGALIMLAKKASSRMEFVKMAYRAGAAQKERLWPTPHGFSKDGGRSNGPSGNELGRAVNQSLAQTNSGSLNPQWVEWLMGYPLGWTDLDRSATQSSRKSRKSSGKRS